MLINRKKLLEALNVVSIVAEKNTLRPILKTCKIETKENRLVFTSTNLECSIQTEIDIDTQENFCVCVIPNDLMFLKFSGSENISLEKIENTLNIKENENITTVSLFDVEEFPRLKIEKPIQEIDFNLHNALENISSVTSNDNVSLSGVRVEKIDNKIYFIATDTFRMLKKEFESKIDINPVTIPTLSIEKIRKIMKNNYEKICFETSENKVTFSFDKIIFSTRVISVPFASWKRIFSDFHYEFCVEIEKTTLEKSLEKVVFLTEESQQRHASTFIFSRNKLEIKATSENKKTKEKLNVICQNDLKISLNTKYILDYVKNSSFDVVKMYFDKNSSPILIDENYLLMPLALIE